jgi:NAD(P)-dependent dehydrogenase (short-subunit alcohol dehydrogenase family)
VDTVVAVNLTGLFNVTQQVVRVMLQQRSGRIVNVSSEGGKTWMKDISVYNACKAGVNGFTRNLAKEVGPLGVSVVAVCPGIMISQRLLGAPIWMPGGPLAKQYERVSVGRCSLPDDVAALVAFLASPAGSYIHGTAISVGGGIAD